MSGRRKNKKAQKEKKPLTNGWVVVPSKTYPDRVYFFNTITKCSTWNNPCEVNGSETTNSSSECSSLEKIQPVQNNIKSFHAPRSRKKKGKKRKQADNNSNARINNEIEDYDDHDQYFTNIPIRAFSVPNSYASPSESPTSMSFSSSLSEMNNSDSEKQSDTCSLLENNKKELWAHFISRPEKSGKKKSVALSDIQNPSTSVSMGMAVNNQDKSKPVMAIDNGSSSSKSSKKKKKKKRSASEKSTPQEKTIKHVAFKKRDKTPAQTRLLNLRAKNAEMLQELAAKHPELAIPTSTVNNKKSILKLARQNDSNCNDISWAGESSTNNVPETTNYSALDYSEEMDWEPSSEESDVRNINVFRQQLERPSQISNDIFFNSDHSFELPQKTHLWLLVLDTNIFVSCLYFIKQLRDTKVPDLGYPVIYVPWRVLQELDHLKDTKIQPLRRDIQSNVRRAIGYLNENFKARHPRIFGQSFEDFMKMVDFEVSAPDDEILQTCIKLQKEHTDKKVMLLTNDKNLESKAIVSNVEVYSKDGFQKKFLRSKSPSPHRNNVSISRDRQQMTDTCFCEAKDIFKEFLTAVVETEMKIAFEGDWIKLAVKKPPWCLKDAMDCLLKHWRSVFFINFSKETQTEVELLYNKLFKKETANTEEVINIISSMQRLISSIEKSLTEKRPYLDLIPSTSAKLSNLLNVLSPNYCHQVEFGASSSQPPVSLINGESQQFPQSEETVIEISKVKVLFKDIWDSLRGFCCSLSDIINSSNGSNEAVIQEMRLKLSQISNEVVELVNTVEKILELNSSEIHEGHPVITYFSNFLIHVYPNMVPGLKNELPKCLAAFFTDFEGRSLIGKALFDFREFIQDLSQATEYFNAHSNR